MGKMKINHLDLFSGVGGFSLALQKTIGEENIGWVGFSDIDKYANQVFKRRFKNAEGLGSVVDINPDRLPRIDLITFGFPCQDLSIAGRRKGFKGERSSLFYEATRIIRATKPKYFIFENVKGTFSSNKGEDFTLILQEIADLGYDGQWQLLNTRWFLPQNRERVYFVGHIRGECRPEVFPIGETSDKSNNRNSKIENCLQHPGHSRGNYKGMTMIADYRNDEGLRIRKNGISPCLPTRRHSETDISTMPPLIVKEATKKDIRRLTPTECERLQGFPDGWTEGQSDTQRYKQMGNAITVDVAEAIFTKLYKEII
tara:strand:+ start:2587 stop:3528 length:942 start_codon:yes stop_codon:yes gene_type:complete